jgi:hypothetical protein
MTLDESYRQDLLVALRLHEISGRRVGEVIAEVEAHVAETGEDPVDAFGTPREYAQQVAAALDPATGKASNPWIMGSSLLTGALTLFGLNLFVDGLIAGGGEVTYTLRDVVTTLVLLLLVGVGVVGIFRAYAAGRARAALIGIGGGVFALIIGSEVLGDLVLDDRAALLALPGWPAITAGAVLLAGAGALLRRAVKRGRVVYPVDRSA